ncbi:MAG: Gfo/Idh/MocA family oxidoreductase [Candidatus Brocadiia bacterium]|nr:MAG: Gfo/Idh/MocA family oxidoreductase [Candidatus Brocadiia bacterium]
MKTDKSGSSDVGGASISRRGFMKKTMSAAAAFTVVPSFVLGGPNHTAPSEKLNIAFIGCGGQGERNIRQFSNENIVAFCDVDEERASGSYNLYPAVPKYRDFRKMLEKEKHIDAVVVTTPDHTHAIAAMTAIRMGKHVYCEKPLAYTIYETRRLTEAARQAKVATQMGIHHHAGEGVRVGVEILQSGVVGGIKEVHLWTIRPEELWSQGIGRPEETPPVPSTLDWDLWLGPAPYRAYHPAYVPFKWRGWWDFGTGAFGNMGCHVMDMAFWALKLGERSVSVEASTTRFKEETYPASSLIRFEFGGLGEMPPVSVTWYDGGLLPWRPRELESNRRLPSHGGIYIGEQGTILASLGDGPRIIPESKMKGFKVPERTLPRSSGQHEEWVQACKGGAKPLADFEYSGPMTELVLLGNLAIRMGKRLEWDSANMKIPNAPEAEQYLHREYRKGWEL